MSWKCPKCITKIYPILVNIHTWRLYDDEDTEASNTEDTELSLFIDQQLDEDNGEDFVECRACHSKFEYKFGIQYDEVIINTGG